MLAAYLPGNSTVRLAEVERPVPGPGQVLLAMKASTICGSDLRAIYREHLGEGPEAYQGVVAGHEPAGQVIEVGPGVAPAGDRGAGRRLPHQRLRAVRRVPSRLPDLLHLAAARRVRLAARRWPRRRPARRGARPAGAARLAHLPRRGVRGLRVRDRVRGVVPGGAVRPRPGADHRARPGRAGGRAAGHEDGGVVGGRHRPLAAATRRRPSGWGRWTRRSAGGDDELTELLGDGAEVAVDCSGAGAAQATAIRHTRRWGRVGAGRRGRAG